MDGTEIALRFVGAFYAFAGFVAARSALMSSFIDRAIAAIGGKKQSRIEQVRTAWMLVAAAIVFAGGVALMALLDVAPWLFLASAAGQAAFLFYVAPRIFDVEDPPDARGRRQSTNAFIIYLAATAFVVWALSTGRLISVAEANPGVLAAAAGALALYAGHIVWTLVRAPSTRPAFDGSFDSGAPQGDPSESQRIKVMADYHTHPLWALDDPDLYGDFPPEALDLSPELTRDLNAWADAFTASLDPDDPAMSRWSDAQHAAHAAEARPLAIRLARERPDRTIYVLEESGVVEVRPDEEAPPATGGARALE